MAVERGTVEWWNADMGWGAIRSPEHDGLGFAHFSNICGPAGYRDLSKSETVEFEFGGSGQDGCQWRVLWVRPVRS